MTLAFNAINISEGDWRPERTEEKELARGHPHLCRPLAAWSWAGNFSGPRGFLFFFVFWVFLVWFGFGFVFLEKWG